MQITSTISDASTTLALDGWLDTGTAPALATEIESLDPTCKELILDLASLEYISSAGLRVIVAAYKKLSGKLTIVNVSPEVMQVFRMAGFDKRLNIA